MDLLKTPDRKRFSRKSITWACSLASMMFIIVRGSLFGTYPPEYIINALITLIVLVLAGTIADKKIANKYGNDSKE